MKMLAPNLDMNIDIFKGVKDPSITANDSACHGINCGMGGCTHNTSTGEIRCMCTHPIQPVDENLNCPTDRDSKPINTDEPNTLFRDDDPTGPSLESTIHQRNENPDTGFGSNALHYIYVIIPALIITLIVILTVSLWIHTRRKRRRHINSRHMTYQTTSSLYKQDQHSRLLDGMHVVGKNHNYQLCHEFSAKLDHLPVRDIPRSDLKLMEEIGQGAFGKVYKGEVKWTEGGDTSLVAVKVLKQDASRETQEDFLREVKVMCAFSHPNILTLLGIVKWDAGSPLMVFELMQYGDLTDMLRKNDPTRHTPTKIPLPETELIRIARQVASGMCYLASQHFVHRDLATRNCLVGTDLVVKISDFGMSRDIYTCDYYKIGGARLLPVRWMSPESIKYGCFTSESDVWSFGVTLWEIFTYGKQPYYGHANEEVIRLLEDGILLQRPTTCPEEVYHVMLGCWRTEPKDRFQFSRIHHHLLDIERRDSVCYPEANHSTQTQITHLDDV